MIRQLGAVRIAAVLCVPLQGRFLPGHKSKGLPRGRTQLLAWSFLPLVYSGRKAQVAQ